MFYVVGFPPPQSSPLPRTFYYITFARCFKRYICVRYVRKIRRKETRRKRKPPRKLYTLLYIYIYIALEIDRNDHWGQIVVFTITLPPGNIGKETPFHLVGDGEWWGGCGRWGGNFISYYYRLDIARRDGFFHTFGFLS